jgi:hypothetical protein
MGQFAMHLDASVDLPTKLSNVPGSASTSPDMKSQPNIEWDWDLEHEDRRKEAQADAKLHGAQPFEVDRKILKDVVREKLGVDVGRITFLSSGEQQKRIFWPNWLLMCLTASQGHSIKFVVRNAIYIFKGADDIFQGYLITLVDGGELVARVARRFMPRLKTQSEVATMRYLRENTPIPVPIVYYYDSNPYNRLGGEYILMSKVCL